MARTPTPEIQATPLRPVASPVESYVRPAEPSRSSLHDVAQGLAAFDTGLQTWLQKREQEQDKADAVRGEAAFNRNNQAGWAEAVATGVVPANASPVFMESYKTTQGNHMGVRLREQFNTEYATWEGRNSDDPEAFDTFLSDFISNNITTDDPYILSGLNPHIEALTESAYQTYSTDRANTIYNDHVDTRAAVVGDMIDHASIQGVTLETGTDYDALMSDILFEREQALGSGIRRNDYDKQLVAAIAAKAIEHGDPMLLEMLDETLPGYDVALSSLPEYRDIKANTIDALEAEARRRMTAEADRQEAEDEAQENAIVRGVMDALAEDPNAVIPGEIIEQWSIYDPEARTKLAQARNTLLNDSTREDPADLLLVERMIQEGATASDIMDLVGEGIIKDPQTFRTLLDRANRREEALAGILGTQTARRYLNTIKERTMPADWNEMFAPDGLTDEGIEATRDFENMLLEWVIDNPGATAFEREQRINEVAEIIFRRIDQQERTYTSQADADAQRAEQEAAANEMADTASDMLQEPQPASPTEPQAGEPGVQAGRTVGEMADDAQRSVTIFSGEAPPDLDQIDETSRLIIEQRAEDAGVTPEQYRDFVWQYTRRSLDLPSDLPTRLAPLPTPQGEQSQANPDIFQPTSSSTHSQTPEVRSRAPLLDLIGHTEGTDRQDAYNETLGYGILVDGVRSGGRGSDVDLTGMTLGEIDQLQTQMLRDPDNEWNSSAVGRYQIIRTTLRGLKQELGLSDDTRFTPELQDQLALVLLDRRGLSDWEAGRISDEQFQDNLAYEWASLPLATGIGAYEGQRVGTDTNGLMSAFAAMRNGSGNAALDAIDQVTSEPNVAYANIEDWERPRFLEWNPDPVGNHEANLATINPTLASVVRRAQEIAGVNFVVGSGLRDEALQRKAIEWGWSKTMDSDHLAPEEGHSDAVDLWPLDPNGAVEFDRNLQMQIVEAMRTAAAELGVELDIGADWQSFQDLPHFAVKA